MWLTSLSIRRPVFVLMMMLTFLVLGYYSYSRMKTELNPNVDFPIVSVQTVYPGAGPEEIETLVSKVIEDAVSSASGVKSVSSVSREGLSVVTIEFFLGTNLDSAFADVRAKVDAITSTLPADTESPSISKIDSRSEPIMYIGLSSPRASRELRDLADDSFKDRLGRVTGVASVVVTGGDAREILVALDPERLASVGVTPTAVLQQLQTATLNLPAGRITEGNREYAVRFLGEFETVNELRNLRINLPNQQGDGPGPSIPLSAIATITDTIAERRQITRLDRESSVTLIVQKSADANTVEVAEGVKKEVEKLEKQYEDIKFVYAQDQSIQVEESLLDLRVSLFLGIFLVVGIVYLFLFNIRGTFIVALAIPTSILATFIVMYFMGFTINTMTMLGLSLAIGILVDDAIVVLENIYRHLSMGEEPVEAAINGRSEIGLAAITITLIDVVVFIPIAFMGGITGQFFKSFGITVAAATLFSLLVSFTITPMLASRWYKKGENVEEPTGFFKVFDRFYKSLERGYRKSLHWAVTHRWMVILFGYGSLFAVFNMVGGSFSNVGAVIANAPTGFLMPWGFIGILLLVAGFIFRSRPLRRGGLGLVGLGVALVLASVIGASFGRPLLNFRFAPDQDQGQVSIQVTLPAGASIDATNRVIQRIEEVTTKHPDVEYSTALVGAWSSGLFGGGNSGARYGEVSLKLHEKGAPLDAIMFWQKHDEKLRTNSSEKIAEDIRREIGQIPGAQISVNAMTGFAGFGAPIQIAFTGQDMARLTETADKALEVLKGIPGTMNTDISWTAGQPEYVAKIDRDRANDLDIAPAAIASVLRVAYEGNDDVKYRVNGREYPIRVRMGEEARTDLRQLAETPVAFRNGQTIPLGAVAEIDYRSAPTKIERQDRNRQVVVSAYLQPGFSPGNMQIEIDRALAAAGLPGEGVEQAWRGENETTAEESVYMVQALMLAFILVYILMAVLFDNLLTPFVVMLSQPMALVGALLALIITNAGLNIVAMIGIIMLIGLVGKNAILLIDYTNTLRQRGLPRFEAILEAGPTRLRPILMTTLAMVLGMLPIALAIGRGSEFRAPLGIAVIGGLILSTLLTLLVIPCSYTVVDDFSNWFSKKFYGRRVAPAEGIGDLPPAGGVERTPEQIKE